jgi:hypothetical protein
MVVGETPESTPEGSEVRPLTQEQIDNIREYVRDAVVKHLSKFVNKIVDVSELHEYIEGAVINDILTQYPALKIDECGYWFDEYPNKVRKEVCNDDLCVVDYESYDVLECVINDERVELVTIREIHKWLETEKAFYIELQEIADVKVSEE